MFPYIFSSVVCKFFNKCSSHVVTPTYGHISNGSINLLCKFMQQRMQQHTIFPDCVFFLLHITVFVFMQFLWKFTSIVSFRFLITSFIVVADFSAANCKLLTHFTRLLIHEQSYTHLVYTDNAANKTTIMYLRSIDCLSKCCSNCLLSGRTANEWTLLKA